MPMHKSQLHRLMRIATLLKENRYPNSETLVKEFRRIAVEEVLENDCGKKTILRDMKVWEHEFGCPLAFARAIMIPTIHPQPSALSSFLFLGGGNGRLASSNSRIAP